MDYLHVKNLEKYHPGYKDRQLHWAKVYFKMVQGDPECEMLCEIDFARLIKFILLELESQKPIPLDENYLIRKGFDLKKRSIELTLPLLQTFTELIQTSEISVSDLLKPVYREEDKNKKREEKNKTFVPPSIDEIKSYFKENGYNEESAIKMFEGYNVTNWIDSKGNPVLSWKQKAIHVWFKEENKIKNSISPFAVKKSIG